MTNPTPKKLSRRDAIKLLGAAAGASVLANLPSKWSTPELASGVLPAHAQTSGLTIQSCLGITGLVACINPDNLNLASQVQISSPIPNISLHYAIFKSNIQFPVLVIGDVLTNNAGLALANVNTGVGNNDAMEVTFYWSFNNAADGTGTCSHSYTLNNSACG